MFQAYCGIGLADNAANLYPPAWDDLMADFMSGDKVI